MRYISLLSAVIISLFLAGCGAGDGEVVTQDSLGVDSILYFIPDDQDSALLHIVEDSAGDFKIEVIEKTGSLFQEIVYVSFPDSDSTANGVNCHIDSLHMQQDQIDDKIDSIIHILKEDLGINRK